MSSKGRFPNSSGAVVRGIIAMTFAILVLSPAIAEAGFITIDPAGMNSISQSSFDGTPIEIRFNPSITIVDSNLLDIDDPGDLAALVALAPDPAPVVDAFFVNQISSCGFETDTFAGCAQLPGHVLIEDSEDAVLSAAPLMGHEFGHNLNLRHNLFSPEYLMWPIFPPGTLLDDQEVNTILQSPLLQTDTAGQKFIEITPIAIMAASEPAPLPLFAGGLAALFIITASKRGAASLPALTWSHKFRTSSCGDGKRAAYLPSARSGGQFELFLEPMVRVGVVVVTGNFPLTRPDFSKVTPHAPRKRNPQGGSRGEIGANADPTPAWCLSAGFTLNGTAAPHSERPPTCLTSMVAPTLR